MTTLGRPGSTHGSFRPPGRAGGDRSVAIDLRALRKLFAGVPAVDGVSLSVERGEFLTLLGPSGCGKTTTLRLIGGFEVPTSGEIEIGGEPMGRRPPERRPINTVFQHAALFPHMSVGRNVGYGLEVAGVDRRERDRRVAEALELVRLPGLERRRPAALSGGERQRVALARALVHRPAVLLLDEPLGALDLGLRQTMQRELRRLHREVGATFLHVTHDQDEALALSDRLAVMRDGRVLQIGTPAEVYDRPSNRFVASFVGDANLLEGVVRRVSGGLAEVELVGWGIVRATAADGCAPGNRVAVVVRPERIAFASAAPPPEWNELTGRVAEVIYLGPRTRSTVRLPGGGTVAVDRSGAPSADRPLAPGDEVRIVFDPAAALAVIE